MEEGQSEGVDKKGGGIDVAIQAQQNALDDLVTVNSMFTLAVFIGLSVVNPGVTNLQGDKKCDADPDISNKLILREVVSFACYLLSSIVAKALKAQLYTYSLEGTKINRLHRSHILALFLISAYGSIVGSFFLSLSMVGLIEIRLGKKSCRNTDTNSYALEAEMILFFFVVSALIIYFLLMTKAILSSVKKLEIGDTKQ